MKKNESTHPHNHTHPPIYIEHLGIYGKKKWLKKISSFAVCHCTKECNYKNEKQINKSRTIFYLYFLIKTHKETIILNKFFFIFFFFFCSF